MAEGQWVLIQSASPYCVSRPATSQPEQLVSPIPAQITEIPPIAWVLGIAGGVAFLIWLASR